MKLRQTHARFWVLLVALVISGTIINTWERAGEARASRKSLKEFPGQLGTWEQLGPELRFDDETETILRADDYLARNFRWQGHVVSLYIGYYATQRNGATYHSPLNCLPGSGWVMDQGGDIKVTRPDGSSFKANRYVIQKGNERALVIYWYQGRGRSVANEYWDKLYTVFDSVARRRSDGALVRVIAPIEGPNNDAEKLASDLASQATRELPAFVPN
ncbi:MAG TPA: EpsI family protein [Pyrinomonadaceae bacterium]|nr:EpsI family protein [Pyrinomonadaceae bacterium]